MLTYGERPRRLSTAIIAGLAFAALACQSAGARADDAAPPSAPAAAPADEGILRTVTKFVAKKAGLATDTSEPQDFVVKSRPVEPQEYIPAGRKTFEREIQVKTPEELKALEADLEEVRARHDAIRSTFAPSVKAVADAEAAKAAKHKKKPPPPADSPQ